MISNLHTAVYNLWVNAGLNDVFNAEWSSSDRLSGEFLVLHDTEAAPGNPMPYCVYEQEADSITSRMSGRTTSSKRLIKEVPWLFKIHAKKTSNESAKEICVRLTEEILKIFGGHPTAAPSCITVVNDSHLNTKYLSDWGMKTGDDEHQWNIRYMMILDSPIAV